MRGPLFWAPVLAGILQLSVVEPCFVPESPLYVILRSLPAVVEELSCRYALEQYVGGLANCSLESLQMYDASTKYLDGLMITNGYYLGHFDQCVASTTPAFSGKYCLMDIQFMNDVEQPKTRFKINRNKAHVAICIPSACHADNIDAALQKLVKSHAIPALGFYLQSNMRLEEKHCTTLDNKMLSDNLLSAKTLWKFAFLFYLIFIISTCLFGSDDTSEETLGFRKCFSFSRHWRKLSSPTPQLDSIASINGLRVIALSCVILGHRTESIASGPLLNPDFLETIFENPLANILLLNGSVIVDVFFTISGLLTCRKILKTMEKGENPSYLAIFWRRYLRLAPAYAIAIAIQGYIIEDMGNGPLWSSKVGHEAENCRKNWWANLLFINNYWDPQHICMDPSWYLACDMQLFILGLIIIRYTIRGQLLPLGLAFAASFWAPFFVTYFNHLDPTVIPDPMTIGRTSQNATNLLLYITGYCRSGPYLVGIASAFVLQGLTSNKKEIPKGLWDIGWHGAILFILGSIVAGYPFFTTRQIHLMWAAIYAGSFRTVFSVGVAFVIIACCCGKGGAANDILSAPPFIILSRVSYSAYLSHTLWMQLSYSWIRSPLYATDLFQVTLILSDLLLSSVVGFAMYLFVEGPITDLTTLFIVKSSKSHLKNK